MTRHTRRSWQGLSIVFVMLGILGIANVGAQQPARRMVVLLFDVGAMQADDLRRATETSVKYVDQQMTGTDLVSVITLGSQLNVLTDFTSEAAQLKAALGAMSAGGDAVSSLNRLRGLKTLCETLTPINQRKAVLYFSSGLQGSRDNEVAALREAVNSCNKGNVSVFPVDARGLAAASAADKAFLK